MSTVTVFVDDAVQGHLPMVGATDGAPAEGLHRIHTSIGGSSGWLWLLIFFGPIGWILLIALSLASGSGRDLMVRLPYTHDALRRERARFREAVVAGTVMFGAAVGLFVVAVGTGSGSEVRETVLFVLGTVAIGTAIVTVALGIHSSWQRPGIDLDASGRWVTLRNVHPAFADACNAAASRRRATVDQR